MATREREFDFSVDESAEATMQLAIEEILSEVDVHMTSVISRIMCTVSQETFYVCDVVDKVYRKIKTAITKQSVKVSNEYNSIVTPISSLISEQVGVNYWLLQQILVKAGKIQPGEQITINLFNVPERKRDPSYIGTVQIDLGALCQCCAELVEVLKEIRDRIPGLPVEYKGEEAAKELPFEDIKDQGIGLKFGDLSEEKSELVFDKSIIFNDESNGAI